MSEALAKLEVFPVRRQYYRMRFDFKLFSYNKDPSAEKLNTVVSVLLVFFLPLNVSSKYFKWSVGYRRENENMEYPRFR